MGARNQVYVSTHVFLNRGSGSDGHEGDEEGLKQRNKMYYSISLPAVGVYSIQCSCVNNPRYTLVNMVGGVRVTFLRKELTEEPWKSCLLL